MNMRYEQREALNISDKEQIELLIQADTSLPPLMGAPKDEDTESKIKRYQRNIDRFYVLSPGFKYNLLISYPRSGRDWVRLIFQELTKLDTDDIRNVNYSNYDSYGLFATHSDRADDMEYIPRDASNGNANIVILIRDPRDSCLSRIFFEHKELHKSDEPVSQERIEHYVDATIFEWERILTYYKKHAKCIIRYEDLCIYPVRTFMKLFYSIGHEIEAGKIAHTVFHTDIVKTIKSTREANDSFKYEEVTKVARYLDAFDRYNHCCNKWRASEVLTMRHYGRIWEELKTIMEMFGYTHSGSIMPVVFP